jgi:hypothetical protein
MRATEVERAAVEREQAGLRQRPAEPGRRQAEGRWRRYRDYLLRRNLLRKVRPNPGMDRVARGQHADWAWALAQDIGHGSSERARPRPSAPANQLGGESQVTLTPKHNLGPLHQGLGDRRQPRYSILADADDGQPPR